MSDVQPEVRSAIVWFPGLIPTDPHYAAAADAFRVMGLDDDGAPALRAWPAAVGPLDDDVALVTGIRLGFDIANRCYVVDVDAQIGAYLCGDSVRVRVGLAAAAAVLDIARNAAGEAPAADDV